MGAHGNGGEPAALGDRVLYAERRLREAEERYALATSAALEGIYEWDLEAGTLFLTEQAKTFRPRRRRTDPCRMEYPRSRRRLPGYRAAIIDHFKGRAPRLEHEYRIVDAEGGYKWVLDRGVGVRNANGRVTKVVGALSDITRRKLAEIEVRRARDQAEESLEQQTAMSEILRVISRSPTDVQPVFDLVAQRAGKLCNAGVAAVSRLDGKEIALAAIDGVTPEAVQIVRSLYPMQVSRRRPLLRAYFGALPWFISRTYWPIQAMRSRTSQRRPTSEPDSGCPLFATAESSVPSLSVERRQVVADSQIDLLKTFADQAVIAIENVRLFN